HRGRGNVGGAEGRVMARGPRVVKSRDEFEGEIYETTTLVEGRDLPAALDGQFAVLGKEHPRVDGRPRVTGRAIYTQDVVLPGLLDGHVLRSRSAAVCVRLVAA